MNSVVICEKPKQAKAVREAVGERYGVVVAAQGHILRLMEPGEVNPAWVEWGYDVLTPPEGAVFFPAVPVEDKKTLFEDMKRRIEAADEVIIATDCDREGEMIGREIVDACAGFKGTMRRAIYTALDPASIRTAFEALRPASDFDRLYDAARARATVDQMANLTLTRAMTVGFRPQGWRGALGVGRVRTPVLGLICRREREIKSFTPRAYHDLRLDLEAGEARTPLALFWRGSGEDRLFDEAQARAVCETAQQFQGPLSVTKERKRQGPPKLPHLTDLQKRAGKWGWSPEKTLEMAQALYDEHRITTYPRSECRYLTESQIEAAPALLDGLRGIEDFSRIAPDALTIRKGKAGHYCTAEVEKVSHDAIVPNANMADQFAAIWPKLSMDERRLFDLIARLWLAAVSEDAVFDQTVIATKTPIRVIERDFAFKATGRMEMDAGWKRVFAKGDDGDEEDAPEEGGALPALDDGVLASALNMEPLERVTQAPKRFRIAELPEVMETIAKFVADPKLRERLKEAKGVGTAATRGAIIEGLIKQGLIVEERKCAAPTDLGMQMADLIEAVAPSLVDPGETARMEADLDAIMEGRVKPGDVILAARYRTTEIALELKAKSGETVLKALAPPTGKMLGAVKALEQSRGVKAPKAVREDFGACSEWLTAVMAQERPPTPKMLEVAKSIAERKKLVLPEELETSFDICKAFLDAHMEKRDPGEILAPTDKQLALAEKLAKEKGETIPDAARSDRKALSAWIDKRMAKGGKPRKTGKKKAS